MKKRILSALAFLALLAVVAALDLDPPGKVLVDAARPRIRKPDREPSWPPTTRTRVVPAPSPFADGR